MKFVVIGGDAAGMSAASRAKRNDKDIEVTVLEQTQDVSYSACGMPYNIADPQRAIDDLVVRKAEVFRQKQGIDLLTGYRVTRIDRKNNKVSGVIGNDQTFAMDYDKLLIATGAVPVVPDFSNIDLPGVLVLKSLNDGRKIKNYMAENPVKKAVIVGMGYIALEMCEALYQRGITVSMVKPRAQLLPWLELQASTMVRQELESHNIGIFAGHAIESIQPNQGRMVVSCSDLKLDADMVLVAVGVKPGSDLAAKAGLSLSVNDSISVNANLQTSDPNIYAAGDCADAYHIVTGKKAWIPLALRANRCGWAVADNVTGKDVRLDGIVGTAVFKVFDLQVARTGITESEATTAGYDPVEVTIDSRSRAHSHPGSTTIRVHMVADKKSGKLLGAQMVGKEGVAHRINAAAVALHAKMTVEEFSQTDLAYAPPFGPVWDPLLTAANQLLKKL